ncbi:hypothetical protein BaRGS_00035547 [Batillaria attramentaria]|uniref:Uncharacterized protein n=1 Tax=Batillaria attramentaria TaxID=370345 RepID=A0ABD0JFR9_9CAEN
MTVLLPAAPSLISVAHICRTSGDEVTDPCRIQASETIGIYLPVESAVLFSTPASSPADDQYHLAGNIAHIQEDISHAYYTDLCSFAHPVDVIVFTK